MKIIDFLSDLLFRHQKKLELIAIFLLCMTISFRFTNFKTVWLWNDRIYIAVILVFIIISIALIWIKIEKVRTAGLIAHIKSQTSANGSTTENPIEAVSSKQKQVFDLIAAGKSNKEIMDALYIELSTLKTHINKIYKILGIRSRKQAQKFKI